MPALQNILSVKVLLFFMVALSGHNSTALAHEWMAPERDAAVMNPVLADSESIKAGRSKFSQLCAYCHGKNAEGQQADSVGLKTSPPNLQERIKTHPDGDFHWKIRNGRGEMPSFKEILEPDEVWNIVNFLRSLSEE